MMEPSALNSTEFSTDLWNSVINRLSLSYEAKRVAIFLIAVLRYEASIMSWQVRMKLELPAAKTREVINELTEAQFIVEQPTVNMQQTYILNRRLPNTLFGESSNQRLSPLPTLRLATVDGKPVS